MQEVGVSGLLADSNMRPRPLIFALMLAGLLDACGGGGSGQSAGATTSSAAAAGEPAQVESTQVWTGHYVGAVRIADVTYFGDAVVTADGAVRLYIGGPYDDGGELQVARPESSEQFVGKIQMSAGQWSGSGVIIGQECAINRPTGFAVSPPRQNSVPM